MKDFSEFEKEIGVSFKNKSLLAQAFTHRSYLNENRQIGGGHNERLEFLGDAVLELAITDFLYEKYPSKTEGDLTSIRSALVNADACAEAAKTLGVNDLLFLSRGETKDTGRARLYILANTLEAIIGAIYLDQGYEKARDFVLKYLTPKTDKIVAHELWIDSKSKFQEKAQDVVSLTPSYRTLKETGPDHDKKFTVGVFLGDTLVAEGSGESKQAAEQEAARKALEARNW